MFESGDFRAFCGLANAEPCMTHDGFSQEFDKFDKNGNGVLERDEWLDWYRSKDHFGMDPDENVQKLVTKYVLMFGRSSVR